VCFVIGTEPNKNATLKKVFMTVTVPPHVFKVLHAKKQDDQLINPKLNQSTTLQSFQNPWVTPSSHSTKLSLHNFANELKTASNETVTSSHTTPVTNGILENTTVSHDRKTVHAKNKLQLLSTHHPGRKTFTAESLLSTLATTATRRHSTVTSEVQIPATENDNKNNSQTSNPWNMNFIHPFFPFGPYPLRPTTTVSNKAEKTTHFSLIRKLKSTRSPVSSPKDDSQSGNSTTPYNSSSHAKTPISLRIRMSIQVYHLDSLQRSEKENNETNTYEYAIFILFNS